MYKIFQILRKKITLKSRGANFSPEEQAEQGPSAFQVCSDKKNQTDFHYSNYDKRNQTFHYSK